MKNLVIAAALVLSASITFAGDAEEQGGWLIKKGTYTGKIVLVDTQKSWDFAKIQEVAAFLAEQTKMNVSAVQHAPACPEDLQKELGANLLISIIDDAKKPTMLLAIEEHWGHVNVAKLVDDLPGANAKKRFRDPRARKELIRAFSLLAGGGASQFKGNMMNAATMKELDRSVDTVPVDMLDYWETYLKAFGITKKELVTYEDACQEGWAPAPTNDVQKKVWNEVMAPPSEPITIKFEPKKEK